MEPTKQAALMICLQKLQTDLVDTVEVMNWQTERAEKAEAEVTRLRSVIEASGSENMRQIVELEDTIRGQREFIQWRTGAMQGLERENGNLWGETIRLRNQCLSLQQSSEMYKQWWVEGKANLARSQRRCKVLLAWARKSCNKVRTLSRGRRILVNMQLKTRKQR